MPVQSSRVLGLGVERVVAFHVQEVGQRAAEESAGFERAVDAGLVGQRDRGVHVLRRPGCPVEASIAFSVAWRAGMMSASTTPGGRRPDALRTLPTPASGRVIVIVTCMSSGQPPLL